MGGSSYFSVFTRHLEKAPPRLPARRHGRGAPRPRAHARQQEPRRRWGGGGRSLPAWAQGRPAGRAGEQDPPKDEEFLLLAACARLPQVHSRLLPARDVGARPRVERAGGARARDAPGGRSCAAAGGWVAGWRVGSERVASSRAPATRTRACGRAESLELSLSPPPPPPPKRRHAAPRRAPLLSDVGTLSFSPRCACVCFASPARQAGAAPAALSGVTRGA